MERVEQDQSILTGLIESDKGKNPESGQSVHPWFLSSTMPGIDQTQTSSNPTGLNLERPPTVLDVAAGRSSKTKKIKATASMATWLRIGLWERKEIYVGDVVGRCYYCSKKLAWEVMEGGWIGKIEFSWSNIIGMQAIFDDDNFVTLNLELKEPPVFFVEELVIKAKKQTTWLKSADFTDGCQASTFRRHSIKFKPGVFNELYADLLSSDARLLALTKKPFPTLDSPFFDDSPTELSDGNPFSAAPHTLPPITSSFPANLTPLPLQLQPILPLHHWQTDESLIEAFYWQNQFGSSANLSPLPQPPLGMSLSIPDNLAPLPLQINQQDLMDLQDLMNQQLHPSVDPLFPAISDNQNVLPKQTARSSSSTTVFDGELIDIDLLLDGGEDATNVVSSSGYLWDVVAPRQSSDQQHCSNNFS